MNQKGFTKNELLILITTCMGFIWGMILLVIEMLK